VKLECGNLNQSHTDGVFKHFIPKIYRNKELIVEHEADSIARYILQQVQDKTPIPRKKEQLDLGWPPWARFDDFLVISKSKDVLTAYGNAMQRYEIPYQITGGNALSDTTEISLLKKLLRAVIQPADPVALVSALRSELFGISDDALYHFKQSGGQFCFLTELPVTFIHEERASIADAFARLRDCLSLFKALPPIVAAENMISRMGLSARAGADPEGNSRAGSLLKVLEVLRPMQQSILTVSDLLDQLELIMNNKEEQDGMPALEQDSPSVRIMNLHKAKGLEAPVVFLAAPCGDGDEKAITCHVDRSGKEPLGYLALKNINFKNSKYAPFMAMPAEWERYEENEREFLKTEGTRLLYVAATRAGRQLIVTQRESRNSANPWRSFGNFLDDCKEFHVPNDLHPTSGLLIDIPANLVVDAQTAIENRWKQVSSPSYRIQGIKHLTVDHSHFFGSEKGRGMKWGSAIHSMLATVMTDQSVSYLDGIAKLAIAAAEMEPTNNLVDDAVLSIKSIMKSEIWKRAVQSSKRFIEAPFAVSDQFMDEHGNQKQTILRGSIDLVFLENDEWVIVDYKTDSPPKEKIPDLVHMYRGQVEKYAEIWERITGIKVAEKGLYFTHHGNYLIC
jgi:ATP-dependent helicase/nuclease subunit A